MDVLQAAKSYYDAGWAVMWLQPRSKRPLELGWSFGPRAEWRALEAVYRPGLNLGVRLGAPSEIATERYLACLDVDVREEQWKQVAYDVLDKVLQTVGCSGSPPPKVVSGKGHGSAHYYFVTDRPFKQLTFGKVKNCWEVVAYSEGRQMVLPPSIHPDTGASYRWHLGKGIPESSSLPVLDFGQVAESIAKKPRPTRGAGVVSLGGFVPVEGAELLALELSPAMQKLLWTAEGDRSAALVPVTRALLGLGATAEEILTILTDPQFALAQCAYDHTNDRDRARAATWLWRYTVERLVSESRADGVFSPVDPNADSELKLTGKALVEQNGVLEDESWKSLTHRQKDGKMRTDAFNIVLLLRKEVNERLFVLDEFSKRVYYGADAPWRRKKGMAITDTDIDLIAHWLCEKWEMQCGPQLVWAAIAVMADSQKFHPIREYLRALEWDGKPRLDGWLKRYLGAEEMPEPYLSDVSRKVLVAAVARVMVPGVKFDHMLVIEGAQGIGKSTAVRDLASDAWFLGALPPIRDKDALVALQGVWFVEVSELATLRRVDAESYKAFFSSATDKFRKPYGRAWEESPRQCVFLGTTNHDDYLTDNSGNRRFWPVKATNYRGADLRRDRDQLFAEAFFIWETFGEELYLSGEAHQQSVEMQSQRLAESEESDMVDRFAEFLEEQRMLPPEQRFDLSRFKLKDLFEGSMPYSMYPPKSYLMVLAARALRARGFERYTCSGSPWWRKAPSTPLIS